MEQDTMKAVRDAELAAEKIEKHAHQERDSILENARQDALKAIEQSLAAEKTKAAQLLDVARSQGETMQQQAVEAVRQDIAALRQSAEGKRAQAKKLIHAALV